MPFHGATLTTWPGEQGRAFGGLVRTPTGFNSSELLRAVPAYVAGLRSAANACSNEQAALRARLVDSAAALDEVTRLCLRALDRVDELDAELRALKLKRAAA